MASILSSLLYIMPWNSKRSNCKMDLLFG